MSVFRFWYAIYPMNTDRRRVVIRDRAGFSLVNHLVDRAHNWRDFYFFVSYNHLGPIDPDHPLLRNGPLLTR